VLIPRPESELLIELSLKHLPKEKSCKILDLGTGSGILAITLASERSLAEVLATDISPDAISVARQNATRLNTENVRFMESNWFAEVQERDFDLIISNPPYIAVNDPHLQQGDVRYEPNTALISAENGLKDIHLIAEQTPGHLKIGGYLFIEHGYNQQADAQAIFKTLNYRDVTTHSDLSGQPRVTSGLWKPL
jgi:release factor glutamine methyltransferase